MSWEEQVIHHFEIIENYANFALIHNCIIIFLLSVIMGMIFSLIIVKIRWW